LFVNDPIAPSWIYPVKTSHKTDLFCESLFKKALRCIKNSGRAAVAINTLLIVADLHHPATPNALWQTKNVAFQPLSMAVWAED